MLQIRGLFIFFASFSVILNVIGQKPTPNIYDKLLETKKNIVANPYKSLQVIDSLKQILSVKDNNQLKIQLYELESQIAFFLKDYNKAFHVLKEIDSLLIISSEMSRLASNYNRWGILLTKMDAYENAMEYLLKAYKIRQNLEESESLINTLNALAALYSEINEADMAKTTIRKALQQLKNSNDPIQKAMVIDNAGKIEEKFGLLDSAMIYYREAIKIQQLSKNNIGQIQTYQNLSNVFQKKHLLDSAFYYTLAALNLANNMNVTQEVLSLKLALSEIMVQKSQSDNAELLLIKIFPEVELSQDLSIKKKAYNLFATIYENKNDFKKALQFVHKSMSISDSLMAEVSEKKIPQLTAIYKIEEREKEIQQEIINSKVKQNILKYQITVIVLIAFFIASIVLFIIIKIRNSKFKLQLMLELDARNQLGKKYNELEQKHLLISTSYRRLSVKEHEAKDIIKNKVESINLLRNNMQEPIKTIVGLSSNILSEQSFDEKQKIYLEKIHNSGKALERILSKVIQNNNAEFLSIPDFNACNLDVIAAEITKYAKEKQIENDFLEIVFSFPQISSEYKLYSNQKAIVKALEYLINNAFSYVNRGIVKIGYKVTSNQLRFYVDDSRVNVSIDTQTIIYQWQNLEPEEHNKLSSKEPAFLYSACQTVRSINSYLSFETSNSWGNIFYFILPLKLSEASKQKNEHVFPSWSGKHILIAEDEFLNFEVLRNYLKPTNARISHARNGQEILEMIKVFKFDLIIMDIKMPQMDGIDAIHELKKQSNKIPVIAQTAHAAASERVSFLQMGFAEFMLKPISRTELYQVIDKLFILTS